jgi:hypothetical protein
MCNWKRKCEARESDCELTGYIRNCHPLRRKRLRIYFGSQLVTYIILSKSYDTHRETPADIPSSRRVQERPA